MLKGYDYIKKKQFIEYFSLFTKQCFVWSIEKLQKSKHQKLQRQKTEE